ncbi:hypothetical protein [Enterococcus sp. N249-2]
MTLYKEGILLIEEKFGKGKDNLISLATIACEPGSKGMPRPVVRDVDAYYEKGVFYVSTHENSNKIKQI